MKRRVLGVLLVTLFLAATSILPSASAQVPPGEDHVLAILTPPEVTFGSEAPAWEIPLPILESSKEPKQFKVELSEVKLGKEVVPASAQAVTSGTVSDLPIALVGGGVTPGELKSYVELNQKLKAGTELTSQEREQYRLMQEKLESAVDKAYTPPALRILLDKLPFAVEKGAIHHLYLTFKVTDITSGAATLENHWVVVINRTLPQRAGWYPGDLHLHSTFSDGQYDIPG